MILDFLSGKGLPVAFRTGTRRGLLLALILMLPAAASGQALVKYLVPSGYTGAELPAEVDRRHLLDARRLARLGDVRAQFATGAMYHALGNIDSAVYWYHRAALFRHPLAAYNLGVLYYEGRELPHDLSSAIRWLSVSAEADFPPAQTLMGQMAFRNELPDSSPAREAAWYRRAALGGDAIGQFNLGVLYLKGHGVEKDEVRALAWLSMAAEELGQEKALQSVRDSLSESQQKQAQRIAADLKDMIRPSLLAGH